MRNVYSKQPGLVTVHRSAHPGRTALAGGLAALFLVSSMGAAKAAEAVDAGRGAKIYAKCAPCHRPSANGKSIGPPLAGVIGRKVGAVEGYSYSDSLKSRGVVWDEMTLDSYLANPKDFAPKSKMTFSGIKDQQQREDLIAYLKNLDQK